MYILLKKGWIAVLLSVLVCLTVLVLAGCQVAPEEGAVVSFEDGTYRGIYLDRDEVQVNIQFTLVDNIIEDMNYRFLQYGGTDYLNTDNEDEETLYQQYLQVLEYLEDKDIRDSLVDAYTPGDFVDDMDGLSGATVRANKVISAIRDGLNRGVYSYG